MQYKTKKCPHCNHAYTVFEPKGEGHYGSPLLTCEKCGKHFIDKDYREIAVDGIRDVDKKKIAPGSIVLFLFWLLFFFAEVILFLNGQSIIFDNKRSFAELIIVLLIALFLLYQIISNYKSYNIRQEILEKERLASESRLQNYQYALFLKQLGYSVPKKYLDPNKAVDRMIDTTIPPTECDTSKEKQSNPSEKPILFCNKCGERLQENSLFCSYCGNKIVYEKLSDLNKS